MNMVWIFVFAFMLLKVPEYSAEENTPMECKLEDYHMKLTPCRWEHGRVPYKVNTSSFNSYEQNLLIHFIDRWNNQVPEVQFVPYTAWYTDYVEFFSGTGCWSYIGRVGGRQSISIHHKGCLSERTVHHEMMHAIGFIHEHTRKERDEYVKILWNKIPLEWQSQYEKNTDDIFYPNYLQPYDYYSLVHYFTTFNRTTVMEILKDADIERIDDVKKDLSSVDLIKIKKFYQDKNFQEAC